MSGFLGAPRLRRAGLAVVDATPELVTADVDGVRIQVGGPALLEQEHGSELAVADRWRGDDFEVLTPEHPEYNLILDEHS